MEVSFIDKNLEMILHKVVKTKRKSLLLEELAKIEELEIYDTEITTLEDMQYLCNLTHLSLENCGIVDISPLRYLSRLQELILFDNKIADITPLKELQDLKLLILDSNCLDTTKFSATMQIIDSLEKRGCSLTYMCQNFVYITPDLSALADNGKFLKCINPIELCSIPNVGGIYFLFDAEYELLYIGKATHLLDRIKAHLRGFTNMKDICQYLDYVKYIKIKDADEREVYETYFINTLYPKLNTEKVFTYISERDSFKYLYGEKWERF